MVDTVLAKKSAAGGVENRLVSDKCCRNCPLVASVVFFLAILTTLLLSGRDESTGYVYGILIKSNATTSGIKSLQSAAHQQQQHDKNSTCSCSTPDANTTCCERVVHKTHKMGYILGGQLFRDRSLIVNTQKFRQKLPLEGDYRDVIITRDWYQSLISGYLYHLSGRECWLDPFGKPAQLNYFENSDWERFLSWHPQLDPPKDGRDFCHYLGAVSEEAAMRVYIDLAWGRWYRQLVRNWKLVTAEDSPDNNRTMFLCYEDLVDMQQQADLVNKARQFLMLPTNKLASAQRKQMMMAMNGKRRRNRRLSNKHRKLDYSGSHSTSHDPALRARLKSVILKLDVQYFNNTIAYLNEQFNCGHNA